MDGLSIRMRLTLVYGGFLFLALALSGLAVVTLLRHRLVARLDASLDHRLQGLENFLVRETTAATAYNIPQELQEYASTQPEGHLIEVRDERGSLILKSEPVPNPSRARGRSFVLYGHSYRTRAAASLVPIEESLQEVGALLLWSSPLLLALIGLTGYWISDRSLRPVDEMTTAARSINVDNLCERLPVPASGDELNRLARAWNEWLDRLETSFSRIQRFTADAAHELRTPITALRTIAELTLRRERSAEQYQEALGQIAEVAERMTQLTAGLLALARGDNFPEPVTAGRVDLVSLVRGIVAEMEPVFVGKSLQVRLALPFQTRLLEADPEGIRRIVTALLDNAKKYTPAGGTIAISLLDDPQSFELEISDTGCGIPQESLTRIFDRFYRVDSSRDRHTGGYGLGLAIAQQIAHAHNGRITASSIPGEGTTMHLSLPKNSISV